VQIAQATWIAKVGTVLIRSDDGVDTINASNDLRRGNTIGIDRPPRNFNTTGTDRTRSVDNAKRIATERFATQQGVAARTNIDSECADLFRP
jgi:hypothetical protein